MHQERVSKLPHPCVVIPPRSQRCCNRGATSPQPKVLGRRDYRLPLLLRDKHVLSRLVVRGANTTEELIVGANKDVFKLYLKGDTRHQSD